MSQDIFKGFCFNLCNVYNMFVFYFVQESEKFKEFEVKIKSKNEGFFVFVSKNFCFFMLWFLFDIYKWQDKNWFRMFWYNSVKLF